MINVEEINPITQNNGPGIRVEVILKNDGSIIFTPNQLVDIIRKFRPYIELNNGGVTFKGDISNIESLKNTCLICHKAGINTCIELIDYKKEYDDILKYIDVVIINDIDFIDSIYKERNYKIYLRNNKYSDNILKKYNIEGILDIKE